MGDVGCGKMGDKFVSDGSNDVIPQLLAFLPTYGTSSWEGFRYEMLRNKTAASLSHLVDLLSHVIGFFFVCVCVNAT